MNGLLLVDKPAGPTSHDVVQHIRRAAALRKVGHTGTLDPAATGLLVLCLGRATRIADFLSGMDKVYEGVLRLGLVTSSHDLDGEVLEERPVPDLTAGD
ncbi:MAG TPA: tRNA pseudouridine(55) synthase, partial [Candidatus Hydrogenedentes bacterium]|nr:tRNA pseudouridine(55) synthase [Candidatus Hydrogenedentota bacterium]